MNLLDKLPHKGPALLIGDVLNIDANGVEYSLLRAPHTSLCEGGMLPAPLGLEAMAQAAAAWMLWNRPDEEGRGMLVQCRDLHMHVRLLDAARGLRVFATPLSTGSATGLFLFSGQIEDGEGLVLAQATFMILAKPLSA
jgi:predicted hotdog family 3-hydroxylacyl-ACP dehydratase